MDLQNNDYHISFFKPTTPQAKANRNMVILLVSIWTVAIFGFQIALRVLQKPTPQPEYTVFESVWDNVKEGTALDEQYQDFGKSCLAVLGKIDLPADAKQALNNALSYSMYKLTSDSLREGLVDKISDFESTRSTITNIADADYLAQKNQLIADLSPVLSLAENDVRAKILPFGLQTEHIAALTESTLKTLPVIMEKYLVHNQSVLTDTKFLGFPFHYFYTAVFLLVLFVGLCWLYCVNADRLNAKFNIAD